MFTKKVGVFVVSSLVSIKIVVITGYKKVEMLKKLGNQLMNLVGMKSIFVIMPIQVLLWLSLKMDF